MHTSALIICLGEREMNLVQMCTRKRYWTLPSTFDGKFCFVLYSKVLTVKRKIMLTSWRCCIVFSGLCDWIRVNTVYHTKSCRRWLNFMDYYRVTLCVSAVFAIAWCPSVTLVDCIHMAEDIVKLLVWPGSPITVVSRHHALVPNSVGLQNTRVEIFFDFQPKSLFVSR